ncbi:hypothetical protein CFter6_4976 [Collimonas fungivorans]|uniref:Uncharacterized protein n=1 Tax=Collimonas fungivorans TaxID=158899 RepID=A0A127PJE8_9BURK|nr:hypothetical protein CFter6_4976 [Collimonas fungivorans]
MGMISTRAFRFFGSSQLRIAIPRWKMCGDSAKSLTAIISITVGRIAMNYFGSITIDDDVAATPREVSALAREGRTAAS